jgi:hypothetical protein
MSITEGERCKVRAIDGNALCGARDALIDDAAKLVETSVLVAGHAIQFIRLLDVGRVDVRLRMRPANHRRSTQVFQRFQGHQAFGERGQSADAIVQAHVVVIVQLAAIRIRQLCQPRPCSLRLPFGL